MSDTNVIQKFSCPMFRPRTGDCEFVIDQRAVNVYGARCDKCAFWAIVFTPHEFCVCKCGVEYKLYQLRAGDLKGVESLRIVIVNHDVAPATLRELGGWLTLSMCQEVQC